MTITEKTADPGFEDPPPSKAKTKVKKKRKRKPVKRATIWLHRWTSFVLGILLLVITTSGAAVVYSPEWTKWSNSDVFTVTESSNPVSVATAMATVDQAHPGFDASTVNVYDGLYEVMSSDTEKHPGWYGVDPGTGKITGHANPERGVMAFLNQVHECFFTCEDYPVYASFLNAKVPTLGIPWMKDITWATVILGVTGLFLVFLGLSGIWLWWPGIKKWTHGFRVRFDKGRYARDYDLHQVIGMAAVPFLLIWGFTGASFELHWVHTAWYAVTGGSEPADDDSFTSAAVKDKTTPDLTLDAAIAAARAKTGATGPVLYVSVPAKDDPTATFSLWFAKGFDQYGHGSYPGNLGVNVDRHDGSRTQVQDLSQASSVSNELLDNLGAGMFHYGQSFNGWWRIIWFLFGLTPLALAVTGVSTWLAKRSVKKRRKKLTADSVDSVDSALPAT